MSIASASLLGSLFDTAAMRALFDDHARLQSMLDFEAALAQAQAELGVIPESAVAPIQAACSAGQYDLQALAAATAHAGNPAIPLVSALTARVAQQDAQAARYVHWGATSQDVLDTGLVLQLRQALRVLDAQLGQLGRSLESLIHEHRQTVMVGRTFLQHAVPITLGLKAAGWWSALDRDRERLQAARTGVLCLQLGGAAGTLSALGTRGLAVSEALARGLDLTLPDLPWHTQRDRIAELGAVLGIAIGSLGKVARDLSLLMQTELAEAREPRGEGRGGSSTMPQKHNPVGCTVVLAAAVRAPGLVSSLLSAMVQEHERGVGGWHAEWETLPALFGLIAGATDALITVLDGLEVDPAHMRDNLSRSGGAVFAEAISMALAQSLGKSAAHALVRSCSQQASAEGSTLEDVVRSSPEVRKHLSPAELDLLFSPEHSLGVTDLYIDRVLARATRKRS